MTVKPFSRRRRLRYRPGSVSGGALAAFLLPFFVPFVLFYLAPVVYAVYQSLLTIERGDGMFGERRMVFGGLTQYVAVLGDTEFWAGLGRVALFGIVQVPIMLALALGIALLLDSGAVKHTAFFRLAPFAPYAVPGVIAAIIWSYFYHPQLSPIVEAFASIGVDIDFFSADIIILSLANISTWLWTGYKMLIILSSLQAIPQEIYEAARLDGASELQVALRIKVPMVRSALAMTLVLSIIGTAQLYTEPSVMQSIAPSISSTFTPNMMAYSLAAGNEYPKSAALAVIIAVISFALSFGVLKFQQRRMAQ